MPTLEAFATHVGVSPSHTHRLFKTTTGLSPKAYAIAHRNPRVRQGLDQHGSVTEVIYGAGYNSSGHLYESANHILGMTPTTYRAGGWKTTIRFAVEECSLGSILVAATDRGVCAIFLGDDPEKLARDLQDRFPRADLLGGDPEFERLIAQVVGFVETPGQEFDLPLHVRGTAFQQQVWQTLRKIPTGTTLSYAEVAKRIGLPTAARAVAGACAANPVAIVIPCHRVVRNNGGLSGYRWGVDRKQALLHRERKR